MRHLSLDGSRRQATARLSTALLICASVVACGDGDPVGSSPGRDLTCNLDQNLLFTSLPPNAIPAINDPPMVAPGAAGTEYLFDDDRVLGVVFNGEARAYPHNILWHHEIVNDDVGGTPVSVTFCPLTGSGLAFRPELGGRTLDLGVSGLLFANNLVMYDRNDGEVYGPQLGIVGACGDFRGSTLETLPVQEIAWGRWKELHPNTLVVSGNLSFGRNYRVYPYGAYDQPDNPDLIQPMAVDDSRPLKERVLAVRDGDGGRGFPYGELDDLGDVVALNETIGGVPTAIFYEFRSGETAFAFDARVAGQTLTFEVDAVDDVWRDVETGSTWRIDGLATAGPLAGERLATRADAYTLFWFAWRHFQPNGSMFAAPGASPPFSPSQQPSSVHPRWSPSGRSEPGQFWGKISFFHHQTTEQFRADGSKRPFINADAESHLAGPLPRLERRCARRRRSLAAGAVLRPRVQRRRGRPPERRRRATCGSPRATTSSSSGTEACPSPRGSRRSSAVNDFPIDAEIIPVGEGQFDFEAWLEGGTLALAAAGLLRGLGGVPMALRERGDDAQTW